MGQEFTNGREGGSGPGVLTRGKICLGKHGYVGGRCELSIELRGDKWGSVIMEMQETRPMKGGAAS